jgi:ParB-like chromosome segregation protein Spo0J
MKIEQIATDKLIPYARNAKRHDAAQVSKLAGSIREFGFNNPVLIDKDNGIVAGHGRVMAAQKLELKTVPCIRLGHLTDTQRRAYILADNRLAEIGGGWDEEMMALELGDLRELDFDLDLIGLDADKIEAILNPLESDFAPGTEDDQGKLDQLEPKLVKCPHCGVEWDLREYEQG